MSSLFSTIAAASVEETNGTAYMSGGIHDNVKLISFEQKRSTNGSLFTEFTFEDEEGRILTSTEWEPTRFGNQTDEEFENYKARKLKRLMNLVYLYYPVNSLEKECNTYEEFIGWILDLLNKADKSVLLRVKVVYENSKYASLPKNTKYTYIERMDVPKTGIHKLSYDNFERPIEPDKEQTSVSSSTVFGSSSGNVTIEVSGDSLPF